MLSLPPLLSLSPSLALLSCRADLELCLIVPTTPSLQNNRRNPNRNHYLTLPPRFFLNRKNNGPTTIKAIVLHTVRVQVSPRLLDKRWKDAGCLVQEDK